MTERSAQASRLRFTSRVMRIQPSPTLVVLNRAAELAARGIDVVDFGPGEPDFTTPDPVREAGKRAIDQGKTRYTNTAGCDELRDAIVESYNRRHGTSLTRGHVIAGSGGKQELFNFILALVAEGDEVVVPSPYWVSFPDQVLFAGATPVFAPLDPANAFRPRLRDLEPHVTGRTRLIILNSPSNPTGAVIDFAELERIVEFCADRGIFLMYDETYEFFVYDGNEHVSAVRWMDRYPETVIVVNSMSKTWAMTGWRLGFGIAHPEIVSAAAKIQSHSTSNPSSIAQHAAIEALRGGESEVAKMLEAYRERRRWLVDALNAVPGLQCSPPDGAFYVFPSVRSFFGKDAIADSTTFANYLLDQARVAVVPGAAFGNDEHVRISYATSMERIREGVERMARALGELAGP
ncbi:MAG TPA: pyridoxal phosphate-dependent aminotransferase [Thermoanaerobaculia bacterium]|nr:pyridoxal phosphate-dependent aminotransferase [Thermoanaerobaculia bacterium]